MNSVISAATIEARNSGWNVLGIMDGFEHLIEGRTGEVRPLSISDVSGIHAQGGSVIRTSRASPAVRDEAAADPDWRLHACLETLRKLGIGALITIGGDGTAFSASGLAQAAGTGLGLVHVPKTIDSDLPLPGGTPTFGFETARIGGAGLVNNLMTDAMTTQRWCGQPGAAAVRVVHRPRDRARPDPAGGRRVELVPGGPRIHDPAGPGGPQ
jgi:ATP-dependent phosphofructokinase / diphosphate-dependent phosphofructokinase